MLFTLPFGCSYGYVVDMMWYLIYIPVTLVCLVASKAQHHAYTFPIRPLSDLQENVRLNKYSQTPYVTLFFLT